MEFSIEMDMDLILNVLSGFAGIAVMTGLYYTITLL